MRWAAVFCICAPLCSCAPSHDGDGGIVAHANLINLSSQSVQLAVKSIGKEPACLSAADLSPYYGKIRVFGKSEKEIFRNNSVNREMQTYKGMDVADGVLIALNGRDKKTLISLSEFENKNEEIGSGYLEFSYSPCSSLFGNGSSVRSMRVSFLAT